MRSLDTRRDESRRYLRTVLLVGRLTVGVGLLPGIGVLAASTVEPGFAGRPLTEALRVLQSEGLRIVFTSQVVRPEMRVDIEPIATEPRAILDELLAPHGLRARESPGGALGSTASTEPGHERRLTAKAGQLGNGLAHRGLNDLAGELAIVVQTVEAKTVESREIGVGELLERSLVAHDHPAHECPLCLSGVHCRLRSHPILLLRILLASPDHLVRRDTGRNPSPQEPARAKTHR